MALSEQARAIRNAKAREWYAKNKEKHKAAQERYFERLATQEKVNGNVLAPVYNWILNHRPKPKSVGQFYSYSIVSQESGASTNEIIEEISNMAEPLFRLKIAVQVGVKSNGERGIRVISLQ